MTARLIESDSIASVLEQARSGALVFLDIDNTLLTRGTAPASEAWEHALTKQLVMEGLDSERAWRVSCLMWQSLQQVITEGTPVEEGTPTVVRRLQEQCGCCVGLTARTIDLGGDGKAAARCRDALASDTRGDRRR